MKWHVSIDNHQYWEYSVEASTEEEAKKKALELNNNPETSNSPVSDWDVFAEVSEE